MSESSFDPTSGANSDPNSRPGVDPFSDRGVDRDVDEPTSSDLTSSDLTSSDPTSSDLTSTDEQLTAGIRQTLDRAVETLAAAGARDEAQGAYIAPHKVLFFTKDAALAPVGRVWRLGVFLLSRDGTLYATGTTTRAVEPGRAGYQSHSAEERRAFRAAALKGRFAKGETVNFDSSEIATDAARLRGASGPLFVSGERVLVRWNASVPDALAIDFDSYLAERVSLLIDPPGGA